MKRIGWCVFSVVLIAFGSAGCGFTTSNKALSRSPTASAVSSTDQRTISGKTRDAIQIDVQQGQGSLTVQVKTTHNISPTAARQLHTAVEQLNQLLQKLQNP